MPVETIVHAYTDGSCRPKNPGYGAVAYLLIGKEKVWVGGRWLGWGYTNNQAELIAIQECLYKVKLLKDKHSLLPLVIHSDSEWSVNSLNGVYNDKKNRELLDTIQATMVELVDVKIQWVRGHAGDPYNEFVDSLAHLATLIPRHFVTNEYTREQFSLEAKKFLERQKQLVETL